MPFGANMEFALYTCNINNNNNGDVTSESRDVRVVFTHNDEPMKLSGCPDEKYMCPYSSFKERYWQWVNGCDFDEICKNRKRDEL